MQLCVLPVSCYGLLNGAFGWLTFLPASVIGFSRQLRSGSSDLQGLSDYRAAPSPELPKLGEMLINRCELYRQKRGNELEGGR